METAIHVRHYAPGPRERQYSPPGASDIGLPECATDHGPAIRTGLIAVISVAGVLPAGVFMPLTAYGLCFRRGDALWIDWR